MRHISPERDKSTLADHFTVDADFTGIDVVEKDLQFVFKARHEIHNQAQDILENGLNHLVRARARCPSLGWSPLSCIESSADRHGTAGVLQLGHAVRLRASDRAAAGEKLSNASGRLPRSPTTVEEQRS